MSKDKDILTIPQAAKYCSVDRVTMWRWVKSGNIRVSVTPGGHHRIRQEDLEAFLREKGMLPLAEKHFPRKRALIVDDDVTVQKALSRAFELRRFDTEVATEGFEAGLKVMKFKPDVIILDLIMPGMDGFEVCNKIKSTPDTAHIKIIVLTGYDSKENKSKILDAGAEAFLVKPVDDEVLFQTIDKLLGHSKR